MQTIHADFSARTTDQCICIPSPVHRLRQLCIRPGDRVRLTDGDLEVEADVEYRDDGAVALPRWSTLTYVE